MITKPSSELAIRSSDADLSHSLVSALKSSLYPGASDGAVALVLDYCHAGGLDPMTKPVHIVPMSVKTGRKTNDGKDIYENRDTIMPGIELYRVKAHRSGLYAGMDPATFGERVMTTFVDDPKPPRQPTPLEFAHPEWCEITVYRLDAKGDPRAYTSGRVYWLETYATESRYSEKPNAMWKKRPIGQLEKCAEALALRRAFPEFVGAQPTAEEMDGKTIDVVQTSEAEPIRQPKPRQDRTERATSAAAGKRNGHGAGSAGGEGAPAQAGEPGIHLEPGPTKTLDRWIKSARTTREAVLARFPRIDLSNLNPILTELRELAAAETSETSTDAAGEEE